MRYLLCLLPLSLYGKFWIFTIVYNGPEYIPLQYKTLQTFLQEDFEYIICDDSNQSPISAQIGALCEHLGIERMVIPQEIHSSTRWSSVLHAEVIDYVTDYVARNHSEDKILILQPDVFFIRPFSLEKELQGIGFSAVFMNQIWQHSVTPQAFLDSGNPIGPLVTGFFLDPHLWYPDTPFVYFDLSQYQNTEEISWMPAIVPQGITDAGGLIPEYIESHKIPYTLYPRTYCSEADLHQALLSGGIESDDIEAMVQTHAIDEVQLVSDFAIHYTDSSNWTKRSREFHQQKYQSIYQLLQLVIEAYREKKSVDPVCIIVP